MFYKMYINIVNTRFLRKKKRVVMGDISNTCICDILNRDFVTKLTENEQKFSVTYNQMK